MKTALLLALCILLSPIGYAQPVKVSVVAVESVDDFKRWLGTPVDPVRAVQASTYPGRVARLAAGAKAQLPIVVVGLQPLAQETRLVADVEIMGSDGKSLGTSPKCCSATIPRASKASAVVLDSTVVVEPDGNRQGTYNIRVTVTDGSQTWAASETLPYGGSGADMPGSANEAPRLRMNVPPAQAEPGGPGDKRDCLSLPTPSEVIRCSEKKK